MSALPIQSTIDQLHSAGLTLSLTPERGLKVVPASDITPALRDLIRTSKAALVDYLLHPVATNTDAANDAPDLFIEQELRRLIVPLAMKVCDHYGDSESAREAMRQDIRETPAHLLTDLLEHFGGKTPMLAAAPTTYFTHLEQSV